MWFFNFQRGRKLYKAISKLVNPGVKIKKRERRNHQTSWTLLRKGFTGSPIKMNVKLKKKAKKRPQNPTLGQQSRRKVKKIITEKRSIYKKWKSFQLWRTAESRKKRNSYVSRK